MQSRKVCVTCVPSQKDWNELAVLKELHHWPHLAKETPKSSHPLFVMFGDQAKTLQDIIMWKMAPLDDIDHIPLQTRVSRHFHVFFSTVV